MIEPLSRKIAWVTGGGSGIGQASAVELARGGATVVVSGRRADALAETAALIKQARGKGEAVAVDTSDSQAVERAAAAILDRHGRIDVLVNCAGTNVPKRFFKDLDAAEWDRVVGTNLNGALYCTLAVLPSMRKRRDGLVIHIASWFARYQSYVGGAAYNASKQALIALVHQINIEEGMHGIRGCAIHPGETVTPLQKARPKPPSPEDQARMLKMEDVGRVVRCAHAEDGGRGARGALRRGIPRARLRERDRRQPDLEPTDPGRRGDASRAENRLKAGALRARLTA